MRLLTLARDLRRRKARERTDAFVAEGVRTVEALLASPVRVRGMLSGPQLTATPHGIALLTSARARGVEITEVDQREFDSAAETESPQGVLAIGEIPSRTWAAVQAGSTFRVVLLDAVQDPGNVGTIIRTSAALGAAVVAALPGTVDLWNAKVVRSAMGTHFTHPVFATSWDAFDAWRADNRAAMWGADAHGTPLPTLVSEAPARLALALGNEGAGLTADCRRRVDQLVALPIEHVESLNVGVAAGILLYELRP